MTQAEEIDAVSRCFWAMDCDEDDLRSALTKIKAEAFAAGVRAMREAAANEAKGTVWAHVVRSMPAPEPPNE